LAEAEQRTGKVDRGRTSDQEQGWLVVLPDVEPRLRRVRGCRALPQLRETLRMGRTNGTKAAVA